MESKEPVLIPLENEAAGIKFVKVAAGSHHCAVIDDKGAVYTWGDGTGGGFFSFGGLFAAGGGQLGHGKDKKVSKPR
jgi:alpha-tubulin suppressor-like RCC1 family protein